VDPGGGAPHPVARRAAIAEPDEADQRDRAGDAAGDRRYPAVGVLGDANRLGRRLRNAQADYVTAHGGQRAVVEGGAGPAEHAAVEDLGRAARPGELVAPVAPIVADDEDRERRVRKDDPEQDLARAHRRASVPAVISGGMNGSSPTSSCGGPAAAILTFRARSEADRSPSVRHTASSTSAYGVPRSRRFSRRSSIAARCSRRTICPSPPGIAAANSSITGR